MNIYKVTYVDFDSCEQIVWFSNKREAQQLLTQLKKDFDEQSGHKQPTIEECKIELNKTNILNFLNFYCHGTGM